MSSKTYFAYIRVSTTRQGHFGTSLVEQRAAIERHAARHNLSIIKEFEEQETAAKTGRPIFRTMISALKEKNVSGIIIHKIDRSARNLRDWAELGELIDGGVEVHFANENLDLYSRGGRLSADIQAVVAADYIRNLREEVRKGFYGRIKQGFYPMPAPLGYLNSGGGKVKTVDPTVAPLIRKTFELYASGKHSLHSLAAKMNELGLRGRSGMIISVNTIAHILHNPFYTGIIRIKISEEYFIGLHEPLVSKQLFDTVQSRLQSKMSKKTQPSRLKETFLFRRLLLCADCRRYLIGEQQKGHIYYRCHTSTCPQKTIREEKVRVSVWSVFKKLERVSGRKHEFQHWLAERRRTLNENIAGKRAMLLAQLEEGRHRLERLTDALISDMLDKSAFVKTKNTLVAKEVELKQTLTTLEVAEYESLKQFEIAFAVVQNARLTLEYSPYERKREILHIVIEKMNVNGKTVTTILHQQFAMLLRLKTRTPTGNRTKIGDK